MTMLLRDIFAKPVDRPIEGVIKADDEAGLRIELEEYVVTNEIAKQLERFLDAYKNYTNANGVWISGFFGSGKSHLLKMLALLLENREIDGVPAYDLFKDKCAGNAILASDLRHAVGIPSKSILFNIDQKADVISKGQIDALLAVFQKVFDEMCGYYGKQPHIAQFERDLDSRGIYEAFKAAYEAASGKTWERGREQALLEGGNIATAYAQVSGSDQAAAANILSKYRADLRVSIEDFANTVKAYIDTQPKGFRLNFFVDEVGQYIAENIKLMTNLQTVAESLNTKCKGQAWIMVTAQQDMTSIIGDITRSQESDFSKIMARFSIRMPLNSTDVAEVIQRRLLSKTDEGEVALRGLYLREEGNLKTLFDFSDGSFNLRNFTDQKNFVDSYPFPPYQYTLFQMAIGNLSKHNAFEGRHSSVGERSMLGVFQEVAKLLADHPVGGIASFDLMFEGISAVLTSSAVRSITVAKETFDDQFAIKVLKALMLVKYVKEFRATVRNIGILMLDRFDADLTKHRRRIEEALGLLERNTLIRRNGEVYEFLTDEEADIESEIKATDIDAADIGKEMETLIFETVIRHRKIRHTATANEYVYSRMLDDRLLGREHELAINVITPFHEDASSAEAVRMRNMSREELAVVLSADDRFMRDLRLHRQTDKFVRQSRTGVHQPARDRIVSDKAEQNIKRLKDLEQRLRKLMSEARLFARGEELDIGGEDPQDRIIRGFQALVDKVYVNLPMLRGESYGEADITGHLRQAKGLLGSEELGVTEGEQEILNFAQSQSRTGIRTTTKSVVERFGSKPYGWSNAAILCVTASLLGRGKLEAKLDGAVLEGDPLEKALKNSHVLGNLLLSPQVEFTPAQTRKLKDFHQEFFDAPPASSDAKALGAETGQAFAALQARLEGLLAQSVRYPFLNALKPVIGDVKAAVGKPYAWYLTDLIKDQDRLLDAKEDVIDPIRRFMGGPQLEIYEATRRYLTAQSANFDYIGRAEADRISAVIEDPACYKGAAIQSLKADLHDLQAAVDRQIAAERQAALGEIETCRAKVEGLPEYAALGEDHQAQIAARLDREASMLPPGSLIATMRDRATTVRDRLFPELLERIIELSAPVAAPASSSPPPSASSSSGAGLTGFREKPARPVQHPSVVRIADLKTAHAKPYLSEPADVDAYLDEMRKTLLAALRDGKRITL